MAAPSQTLILSSSELSLLAKEVGFDLCGFAKAEPIPPRFLMDWLEAGFDADMDWMGNRAAERLDVRELLPSAQAVMSFACSYRVDDEQSRHSPISLYARGRDYHATLRDRLRAFRRELGVRYPEVETYGGIDAGPLMEKIWAARSGLGFVGKNGCFISPEYGSYVVLATLILGAPVDAVGSGPSADRCGGCTLCITSCPTDALVGDGEVDARRCLSYQSIENSDLIPTELRHGFAHTVFGCDICQTVCPLNDDVLFATSERFAPRPVANLTIAQIAALSREEHAALVPGTAIARAKYDGLRRNAAYALGATKERSARELLTKLSEDPSEKVRDAAIWALRQIDSPEDPHTPE